MPSIEVVCVDQKEPVEFVGLPFAVVHDLEPVSHRSPRPLFQRELDELQGCIYHVGNPDCAKRDYQGAYFAYRVLSVDCRENMRASFFEIAGEFQNCFKTFLRTLLEASPVKTVFFYSDWQGGPSKTTRCGTFSEAEFWRLHDARSLKLNACYTLKLGD